MIGTCERGLGQVQGPYQRGSAGARCDLTVIRCQNEMVALQPFKKSFNQSQLRGIHACMHTLITSGTRHTVKPKVAPSA